jgi:hypothetical protein
LQVRVALKAAFGAVDRAADFLMSGHIPDSAIAAADAAIARGGAPAPAPAGAPAPADGGALAALRRHPQINEMRTIVQSNPGALPALLAQIGQQSPQLLELIQANQQEFVAMMNEPIDEEGGGGEDDDGDDGKRNPFANCQQWIRIHVRQTLQTWQVVWKVKQVKQEKFLNSLHKSLQRLPVWSLLNAPLWLQRWVSRLSNSKRYGSLNLCALSADST